ncbi:hypothetical protein fugu_014806 [Takifugu bimaculatus]|uniref:EB1 C-terminal domain-containing protein n=1 Tax=Takifugu bimaculatus TaxID=433685 RepID=A0A4Z2C4B1_9TELE|nr:hypothetical protein fugu_014806 [Takifugu bimaculatus]
MPGPTQALSPNGENNNDIVPESGSNIIPYRKNTVRQERAYRAALRAAAGGRSLGRDDRGGIRSERDRRTQTAASADMTPKPHETKAVCVWTRLAQFPARPSQGIGLSEAVFCPCSSATGELYCSEQHRDGGDGDVLLSLYPGVTNPCAATGASRSAATTPKSSTPTSRPSSAKKIPIPSTPAKGEKELEAQVTQLTDQVNTLKSALEGVEKERDYYFSKLREVELLCQEQSEENAPFVDRLMEILYASDEQEGAELAEGNGEEAEQQIQEEGGDDQQEEQDEY